MTTTETAIVRPKATLGVPAVAVPQTFDEAMRAFNDPKTGGGVVEVGDLIISEWKLVEKETLIGVPFLIVNFRFSPGVGASGEKVSVQVMTEDDRRLVFNDGSTGVYNQLLEIFESTGRGGGIVVKGGLSVSDYYYDPKGKLPISKEPISGFQKAATYYLALT